jgi:hypothetical protein
MQHLAEGLYLLYGLPPFVINDYTHIGWGFQYVSDRQTHSAGP